MCLWGSQATTRRRWDGSKSNFFNRIVRKHARTFDSFAPENSCRTNNLPATRTVSFIASLKASWFKVEVRSTPPTMGLFGWDCLYWFNVRNDSQTLSITTAREKWAYTAQPPSRTKTFCTSMIDPAFYRAPTVDRTRTDVNFLSPVVKPTGLTVNTWYLVRFWMQTACWQYESVKRLQWMGASRVYQSALCNVESYSTQNEGVDLPFINRLIRNIFYMVGPWSEDTILLCSNERSIDSIRRNLAMIY